MPDVHHRFVNLPSEVAPVGYSDAAIAAGHGRWMVLGGHVAFDAHRRIVAANDLLGQMRQTLMNIRGTLAQEGGRPEHVVKLTLHVLNVSEYRRQMKAIGAVWRDVFGRCFPAMTLLGVSGLFDEAAMVEIDGLAWLPRVDRPGP